MVVERRVCVNAMPCLKKNSTKLLIAMCLGIALALYGIYVQSRTNSNPDYRSSLSLLSRLAYDYFGSKVMAHYRLFASCPKTAAAKAKPFKEALPHFLMSYIVKPTTVYSGLVTGLINVAQILLLKVYCRSIPATRVIMGLSVFGLSISMICMIGAFVNCKLMCISCVGLQHIFIIYYAICRMRIISTMFCPSMSNSDGACTYPNTTGNEHAGRGNNGMIFGNSSAIPRSSSSKSDTGSVRRRTNQH